MATPAEATIAANPDNSSFQYAPAITITNKPFKDILIKDLVNLTSVISIFLFSAKVTNLFDNLFIILNPIIIKIVPIINFVPLLTAQSSILLAIVSIVIFLKFIFCISSIINLPPNLLHI
ncbi:hypothetical protein SDC9_144426 [bioreactor metagenome]|uniref:Uncharacterized protein n=1 Tax=bioreactor metagenome TaxID=1076179 RepID=A0A645E8W9_9ZZZZ